MIYKMLNVRSVCSSIVILRQLANKQSVCTCLHVRIFIIMDCNLLRNSHINESNTSRLSSNSW